MSAGVIASNFWMICCRASSIDRTRSALRRRTADGACQTRCSIKSPCWIYTPSSSKFSVIRRMASSRDAWLTMFSDPSVCSSLLRCRVLLLLLLLLLLCLPAAALDVLIVVVDDEPASFGRAGDRGCRVGMLARTADMVLLKSHTSNYDTQQCAGVCQ